MTTENGAMMVAAAGKGQENGKLAKREAFAAVARQMDELAVAAQDAFAIRGNFARTFALGAAMADLREALDERVMASIMKLQNTKLGFRTDMERGYPVHVVRDAVIEATVWGLQCVGNQFNIIAGGFYATKEGYTYLLRNMPGLEDMRFVYHPAVIGESSTSGTRKDGTPYQKIEREGKTVVDVSWVYQGVRDEERLEFCIRVNAGMSQDAILGKAERKAKKWLFERLTDRQLPDGEADEVYVVRGGDAEVVDVPAGEGVKGAGIEAAVPPVVRGTNGALQVGHSVVGVADEAEPEVMPQRLHPELDDFEPTWPEWTPEDK
ncbi:MAG: hypothetical protein IJN29_05415 [Akkermansia sp.]|nr:hypothetical protein [Akkermansia sp.]